LTVIVFPEKTGCPETPPMPLVTLARRAAELGDDPPQRVVLVALAVTGRHHGDDREPINAGGTGHAGLVLGDEPPHDRRQIHRHAARRRAGHPLVPGQRVVELSAREAVGDRRDGGNQ